MVRSLFLIGMLALAACGTTIGGVADNAAMETAKQMKDAGLDVYLCFNLSGPPPSGGFNVVGVPQGKTPDIRWGSNCQPMEATTIKGK
jgi:hypothetical protein